MTNEELAEIMSRLVERFETALSATNAKLEACDRGIAGLIVQVSDLDVRLAQTTGTSEILRAALIETSGTVQTLIQHLDSHVDTRVKQSMDERQSFNEIVLAREARERG